MSVLEKQRTRADDAKMLLQHIVEFNTGMETSDIFLNESRIHEAAIVAKRLQTIAQDLDSQQTNLAKEAIDAYCKRVERSLLEMLNDSFRGGDITTMKVLSTPSVFYQLLNISALLPLENSAVTPRF